MCRTKLAEIRGGVKYCFAFSTEYLVRSIKLTGGLGCPGGKDAVRTAASRSLPNRDAFPRPDGEPPGKQCLLTPTPATAEPPPSDAVPANDEPGSRKPDRKKNAWNGEARVPVDETTNCDGNSRRPPGRGTRHSVVVQYRGRWTGNFYQRRG